MQTGCSILATLLPGVPAAMVSFATDSIPVQVHSNGNVTAVIRLAENSPKQDRRQSTVRYEFGLPAVPAVKRWVEDEKLPIYRTQWEWGGIRYIQTVLVSRLGEGDLQPGGQLSADAVLLVNIYGENLVSEYAKGTAQFAMRHKGRLLPMDLRGNAIYVIEGNSPWWLGVIDIPSSGVVGTNGLQLRFEGNIPPSNNGAMTIKIPLGRLEGKRTLEQLLDMEFEAECQRVKAYWSAAPRPEKARQPIRWAEGKP